MKKIHKSFNYIVVFCLLIVFSCGEVFLEKKPQGALNDSNLATAKGVEAMLVGAYAVLDGMERNIGDSWRSAASNWVYGDVTSDDAYKGTEAGDQPPINPIESYAHGANNVYFNTKWRAVYDGISRTNDVLKILPKIPDGELTDDRKKEIEAEAKFLRGHYYFEAKKMWNSIPYIDEKTTDFKPKNSPDVWDKIEADFQAAENGLPADQDQVGRATKGAAQAYLGKAYMFQKKYTEAQATLKKVIDAGKYSLATNFHDNFRISGNNNSESVFQIQRSVKDGGQGRNGGYGDVLGFLQGGPGGCCGFHQPSHNLVNAYQTDANGLPLLDTFNDTDVKHDQGIESSASFDLHTGNLDPRLDWTVGRRGIPYLDWGDHPGKSWVRDQPYAGPFSSKKNMYYKSEEAGNTDGSWGEKGTSNNYSLIRYADVLLWAAEAEVEVGSLEEARKYVNLVRKRAKDGSKATDDDKKAKYVINEYTQTWTDKDEARKAVRFERRLELAMEGHRFFDLVRWEVADVVLNKYLEKEKAKRNYLTGASFTKGKNEYYPIPEQQIILSSKDGKATLDQNPGY